MQHPSLILCFNNKGCCLYTVCSYSQRLQQQLDLQPQPQPHSWLKKQANLASQASVTKRCYDPGFPNPAVSTFDGCCHHAKTASDQTELLSGERPVFILSYFYYCKQISEKYHEFKNIVEAQSITAAADTVHITCQGIPPLWSTCSSLTPSRDKNGHPHPQIFIFETDQTVFHLWALL